MDPPPPFHHHHLPNFPAPNLNSFFSTHHRLPPPPLLPPPPQHHHGHHPHPNLPPPPSLPPPLPPPPPREFNFQHSYRPPINQRQSQVSNYIPHHLLSPPRLPRVSSSQCNENNTRFSNNNYNYRWNEASHSVRVQPDHPFPSPPPPAPRLPPPPPTFDNGLLPGLDFGPDFDVFERNGRFVDECHLDNRFMYNGDHDVSLVANDEVRGWDHKNLDSDIIDDAEKYSFTRGDRYRDVGFDESLARNCVLNAGKYEVYDERDEDPRLDGYSPPNVRMETESVHGSPKQELFFNRFDSGRLRDNDRVREARQWFVSRSPRKKPVQKKSALHRIKLGTEIKTDSNRNRAHDSSQFSNSHFDKSLSNGVRGKERAALARSDRKIDARREKSPVELDVSFKSNSLVAKAILTPSSPAVDFDRNSTPRNRKIRKIDLSSSPLTKTSENICKANNSANGFDSPSDSGKTFKRSPENIVSADRSAPGSGLQPRSSVDSDVPQNATAIEPSKLMSSESGASSAGACGTPLRRIKRTKVAASSLQESVLQPVKNAGELTKADKSTDERMKHLVQIDASADAVLVHGIALLPSSNETNLEKVHESSEGIVFGKDNTDIDSSRRFCATFSNLASPINTDSYTSRSEVDAVISNGVDQTDRSNHSIHSVSNLETTSTQVQPKSTHSGSDSLAESTKQCHEGLALTENDPRLVESTHSGTDQFGESTKQTCHNGLALTENAPRRGTEEVTVSVQGNLTSNLSSPKELGAPMVQLDTTSTNFDTHRQIDALDHAGHTVADASVQYSGNAEGISIDNTGSSGDSPEKFLVKRTIVCRENNIHENSSHLSCPNHSLDIVGWNISSTGRREGNVSDLCSPGDDGSGESHFDLSRIQLEKNLCKGYASGAVSDVSVEDASPIVQGRRKITDRQLSSSGSPLVDVPANLASHINSEDAGVINSMSNVSATTLAVCSDREDDTMCRDDSGVDPQNVRVSDQDPFVTGAIVASPILGKKRKPNEGLDTAEAFKLSVDVCSGVGNGAAGETSQAELTGDGLSKKRKQLELVSSCSPQLGADPEEGAASAVPLTNHPFLSVDVVSQGNADQLTDMVDIGVTVRDRECDDYLPAEDNFGSVSSSPSLCANRDGASAMNSADSFTDSLSDGLSYMGSPEILSIRSHSEIDDSKASVSHISDDHILRNNRELLKRPLSASDSELDKRSGLPVLRKPPVGIKTASSLSKAVGKVTQNWNSVWVKSSLSKNNPTSSVPRPFPGRQSQNFCSSKKATALNPIGKPRTWHRTDDLSSSVREPVTQLNPITRQKCIKAKVPILQSSYVRKGNSLVRNASTIATTSRGVYPSTSVYPFNFPGLDNSKKGKEFDTNPLISTVATDGRPPTPPFCSGTKLLSGDARSLNCPISMPRAESHEKHPVATTSSPLEFTLSIDSLKSLEGITKSSEIPKSQTDSIRNVEGQSELDETNFETKIIYVKRKSNQLVASLGAGNLSLCPSDKSRISSSDGYYKRRKNQLVRKLLENHQESISAAGVAQKQGNQKSKPSGNGKNYKPLKFSSVWTLGDRESSESDGSSVRYLKVWPYLFPWKRAKYRRNSMAIPNDNSLSIISRKLLMSRKRETIYTRSVNGFSLRRSKVLSVGGSNLKWSKSIERNSKKANEEATLAVAAAERSKKERSSATSTVSNRRNHVSRGRIFRIGSERYKMDPTGKALLRITNDEDQLSRFPQAKESAKKSYIPRRLLIGNDEYVRIGNGNKLVRDPKKRMRALASEKVRWSLHTVRLRLAKKRTYCQFFTRFGKCNKDGGKCPYIHDPSKIAVCTKFLNGSCSNSNCKLTHEVIPERMPDCSYFLQGLCSNENCPYRHVNVNPSASVCEGFLRGYCADSNECRKKHTYVCPVFEATGVCPQGSKCKLHHPKRRKGMRKPSRQHKNLQGRYFGSSSNDMIGCRITGSEKLSKMEENDVFCQDGRFIDFISLDISDDEVEQAADIITEPTSEPGPSDSKASSVEELIKPLRLLNKNNPMADPSVEL